MPPHIPHSWDLEPQAAVDLQRQLADAIDITTPIDLKAINTVAGVDVSVKKGISRAAIVIMTYPDLQVIETQTAQIPTPFPYIPGLLSFREGAVILKAWGQVAHTPDVAIFDGQGYAHPRRLGIACHMGLWFGIPTVGCGKTRLIGRPVDELAVEKGSRQPLYDGGEQVGVLLRTRTKIKPVYASAGHHATHATAADLILACAPRYRLPEPIRKADKLAGAF